MQPNDLTSPNPLIDPQDQEGHVPIQPSQSARYQPTGPSLRQITPNNLPTSPNTLIQPQSQTQIPVNPTQSVTNGTFPQSDFQQEQSPLSQSDIEASATKEHKKKLFKKLLIITLLCAVVVAAIIASFILAKGTIFSNLDTKTLTNGNYTYTFKFYKSATLVDNQGLNIYVYKTGAFTASISFEPSNEQPLTSCSNGSTQLTQVFTVPIEGSTYPVCTNSAQADNFTVFSALNHSHVVSALYLPAQSNSVYPTLKTILSSIQVSH